MSTVFNQPSSTPSINISPTNVPKNVNLAETPEQILLKKSLTEKILNSEEKTSEEKEKITVFRMKFKKGPISQEVFFEFTNDQRLAEIAAREYCGRFRLRFIWVEKLYIDITSLPVEAAEND